MTFPSRVSAEFVRLEKFANSALEKADQISDSLDELTIAPPINIKLALERSCDSLLRAIADISEARNDYDDFVDGCEDISRRASK